MSNYTRSHSVLQVTEASLRDAVVEFLTLCDKKQNYIHIRIADGGAKCDEQSSFCLSRAEYNRTPGCEITVKHQFASGQCNLSNDWADSDEGVESIQLLIDAICEDNDLELI